MDGNTRRTTWACPLVRWDTSVPDGSPGRTSGGEGKPLLLHCYWPEAARCASEGRCASGALPGKEGRDRAPGGPGPGLRWPLQARDIPNLSGAAGARPQDPHGLRSAASLDALVELFPAPSPASAPGFLEKLS